MNRHSRVVLLAAFLATLLLEPAPRPALSQESCPLEFYPHSGLEIETCQLGTPNAEGETRSAALSQTDERKAFRFHVGAEPQAAHIYLGDQWYDLDVALYEADLPQPVARWLLLRKAETSGTRVIQFVRPEKIIQKLKPNTRYTILVLAAYDVDPSRPFTLRVALGPEVCAKEPHDDSADDALTYLLAITVQPPDPGPFSLVSFNAFVSPPYSDLFDFEWEIDGQPVPGAGGVTIHRAASDFQKTLDGMHRVRVTARGARDYPDPDQPHRPPTLSVECAFRISA
jgi:hypothetical protein